MQPRLVLVRPRNADNLVAIAAAMRTFGLHEWVAVSSEVHLVGMLDVLARHRVDAPSLETLRRVDTLKEAVAGCSFVVGTTMRAMDGKSSLCARELAGLVRHRAQPWALVFGAESNGLQNDDLAHCHALSFIPAHADQPSLNLSQAVVVFAHELNTARADPTSNEAAALATSLEQTFGGALMPSVLRAAPTAHEGATWRAVCQRLTGRPGEGR